MIFSVTIWMGMGERGLLGYGLDGNGISYLSRERAVYQIAWLYRVKSTEMSPGNIEVC